MTLLKELREIVGNGSINIPRLTALRTNPAKLKSRLTLSFIWKMSYLEDEPWESSRSNSRF